MQQINGRDSRDCTKSATNESETVTDIFDFGYSFSLCLSWQRSNTLSIASELGQPQTLVFDPSLVVRLVDAHGVGGVRCASRQRWPWPRLPEDAP